MNIENNTNGLEALRKTLPADILPIAKEVIIPIDGIGPGDSVGIYTCITYDGTSDNAEDIYRNRRGDRPRYIYRSYEDEDGHPTKPHRYEFRYMLSEVRKHCINIIVLSSLDQISKYPNRLRKVFFEFKNLGVRICCLS